MQTAGMDVLTQLRAAHDQIGRGAWFADIPARPWLRLAAFLGVGAVYAFAAIILIGMILSIPGMPAIDPEMLTPGAGREPLTAREEIEFLAILSGELLLLAGALLAAAMTVYRRGADWFLRPAERGGVRLLMLGFLFMMALGGLMFPIATWLEPDGVAPILDPAKALDERLIYAGATALCLLIAALGEEIVFRGVLMRILAGLNRRPWLVMLISGVVFSLIHFDPDPVAFTARAMSGMVWAWSALRLGGISFAVGAHWANNLFIAWMLEPISSAAAPGQGIPVEYLAFEVVTVLAVLAMVELIARRRA